MSDEPGQLFMKSHTLFPIKKYEATVPLDLEKATPQPEAIPKASIFDEIDKITLDFLTREDPRPMRDLTPTNAVSLEFVTPHPEAKPMSIYWHGLKPFVEIKLAQPWPWKIAQPIIHTWTEADLETLDSWLPGCKDCHAERRAQFFRDGKSIEGIFCEAHRPMRDVTPKPKLLGGVMAIRNDSRKIGDKRNSKMESDEPIFLNDEKEDLGAMLEKNYSPLPKGYVPAPRMVAGEIVWLKTGGPAMTVCWVNDQGDEIQVAWFNKNDDLAMARISPLIVQKHPNLEDKP